MPYVHKFTHNSAKLVQPPKLSFAGPTTREPTPTFHHSSAVDCWTNQGTGAGKIARVRPPSPRIHAPPMLSGMTPPCACVYACVRTQTPTHYSWACIHAANLQDPYLSDARPVRAFVCIARWPSHASVCVNVFYGCICMQACGSARVYIMYAYLYRI